METPKRHEDAGKRKRRKVPRRQEIWRRMEGKRMYGSFGKT